VECDFFTERQAADTIRPIVDALKYCHSMGIAHRDLKVLTYFYLEARKFTLRHKRNRISNKDFRFRVSSVH